MFRSINISKSISKLHGAARFASYDVAVIGGGPGGYVCAIRLGQLGKKVVCIDPRGTFGGTCLNVGCIPTKALLHTTEEFENTKTKFAKQGIVLPQPAKIDMKKMMANKEVVVKGLTSGIEMLFKKNKVTGLKGKATFTSAKQLKVKLNDGKEETVDFENAVIASGSIPRPLPSTPVDNKVGKIVDSTGALSLEVIPSKLAVIGGGVIGLEIGSVYSRLGSKVTVIESMPNIIPFVDTEMRTKLEKELSKSMKFIKSTNVIGSAIKGEEVELTLESNGKKSNEKFSHVLVAIGRIPYIEGLGLDKIGVKLDERGRIETDNMCKTNIDNIYAIGDCIKGPMLAHKAEEDGMFVANTIGKSRTGELSYDVIPSVIYTYPELACVGKTEDELKKAGIKYKRGNFPFMGNGRAKAMNMPEGNVKILADKESDKILGIHILGGYASEMIAEACLALEYGASSEDIARTCHPHPTLSEAVKEAAMATYDKCIHS